MTINGRKVWIKSASFPGLPRNCCAGASRRTACASCWPTTGSVCLPRGYRRRPRPANTGDIALAVERCRMRFLAVLAVLWFATLGWTQDKIPKDKLHIYILAGQSNMSGRAKVQDEDQKIPAKLLLLDSAGKWTPATHPFIQYTNV